MTSKTKLNIYSIAQILLIIYHAFDSAKLISTDILSTFTSIAKMIFLALLISDFILKPFTKKTLTLSLISILMCIIFTITSRNEEFLLIILAVLAARDINIDKLIFRDLIIRMAVCAVAFSLFCANADTSAWQASRISLGFYHPNTLGGMLMIIGIEMMYVFRNSKNPVPYLFSILLLVFNWMICKSRTSLGVLTFAILCFILLKLNVNLIKNKVSQFLARNSYVLFVLLSFTLVLIYRSNSALGAQLDSWFSTRLSLADNYLNIYGINLFGNAISTFDDVYVAVDGTLYYTVDMAFICNALSYGIVGFLFFSIFYNLSFRELYKEKKYFLILSTLLMLVYGMMETGSFRYCDNTLLVILSAGIFSKNENEEEFYLNKYIMVIFTTLMVCLFFFRNYILNYGSQFIISENQNMYNQYKFLLAFYNRFHSLDFSSYDWSLGLGSSSYNLYSYGMLSPFNLLILPLKQEWLSVAVLYLNIFKFVILGVSSTLWLSTLSDNKNNIIAISLMITFSSLLLSYYGTNYFDYYCLLPLTLFFIERAINENKFIGLPISILILLLSGPSLLVQTIIFVILYTLMRVSYLDKFNKKDTIKLILFILLSVGLSCFITVPCINAVSYTSNDSFFNVLISLLTPLKDYAGTSTSIYTSLCGLVLIPYILKFENKKRIILSLSILFSIIFSIIFSSTFGFFGMIVIGSYTLIVILDDLTNFDLKYLLIGAVPCLLILIINYFVMNASENEIGNVQITLYITVFVLLIISIALLIKEGHKGIIFSIMLELCISMYCLTSIYPLEDDTLFISTDITNKIKKNDNGLYRTINADAGTKTIEKTSDEFNLFYNYSDSSKQIPGISINNSNFNSNQSEYIDLINENPSENYLGYDKNYLSYYNIAGVKYWYSDDENTELVPPSYFEKVDGTNYYKNKYFIELGYVNNNLINTSALDFLSDFDKERALREYVAIDSSDNYNFTSSYNIQQVADAVYYGPLDYTFDSPISNVTLTIVNGGVPIVDVEVLYNGELLRTEHFYQYNFCNVTISENELVDRIVVKYDDVDNTGYGIAGVYMSKPDSEIEEELYNQRINNSFTNINFDNDYISASISISSNDSFVYTYIPYDDNWIITDNGVEVEKIKANFGFIGFYLNEGNHNIEFAYKIPGKTMGIICSLISLFGIVLFCLLTHKQNNYRN